MLINRHESTISRASKRIEYVHPISWNQNSADCLIHTFLHGISFDSPRPSSHIFLNLFPNSLRSLRGICRNTIELFAPRSPCAAPRRHAAARDVREGGSSTRMWIVEGCRHASWKNNFTNNGTATRVRATNSYALCTVKSALSTSRACPDLVFMGRNIKCEISNVNRAQVCSHEITDGQREMRRGKKRERNCCATWRKETNVEFNTTPSFSLFLSLFLALPSSFFFSFLLVLFALELAFPSNSRRNAPGALIRRR